MGLLLKGSKATLSVKVTFAFSSLVISFSIEMVTGDAILVN